MTLPSHLRRGLKVGRKNLLLKVIAVPTVYDVRIVRLTFGLINTNIFYQDEHIFIIGFEYFVC